MKNIQEQKKQSLLFIRHGQTQWNVEHRLAGQVTDISLTKSGEIQAQRIGEALKPLPITAVISSPFVRARDTAIHIAQSHHLPVQLEIALKDTDVGHWTGQDIYKLNEHDPIWQEFVRNPNKAPAGVETFLQVQQRAVAAVEYWRKQRDIGNSLAFVTHADVIKLLLAYYTGLDAGNARLFHIENASVSMIKIVAEQRAYVIAINWNPEPDWLQPQSSLPTEIQEASQVQAHEDRIV